jgi:hypothetical protein
MMDSLRGSMVAAMLALAGCSTNAPLMFGDSTTFGLRLGNDTVTSGGSVSLGYKAQSVAVVPVSVLNDKGEPKLIKGHGRSNDDAMSVFAVFESNSSTPADTTASNTVRLGQVFSTGLAAQALTLGYSCRERADTDCTKTATTTALEAAAAADRAATAATQAAEKAAVAAAKTMAGASAEPRPAAQVQTATTATDRPYQAPLLFLRTDVVGIDIGGSLAQQGLQFNLGYSNRNIALIPTHATGSGGRVFKITGGKGSQDASDDALSVLGQFRANTQTTRLGYGLDRYFATGVAARNLGDGIAAAIARTPLPATAQSGSAAAPATTK